MPAEKSENVMAINRVEHVREALHFKRVELARPATDAKSSRAVSARSKHHEKSASNYSLCVPSGIVIDPLNKCMECIPAGLKPLLQSQKNCPRASHQHEFNVLKVPHSPKL